MPELVLRFPAPDSVNVTYAGTDSGPQPFASPVTAKNRADIAWYIETYGARSLADPDDTDAKRIEARLPEIGKALFKAVFSAMATVQPYLAFRNDPQPNRVITIDTQVAAILSLPWELLHDPTGVFLFRENPRIGVRRRISGATGGRAPFPLQPKAALHLLFVVSRPSDAGFIDPRADAKAVLDAVETHAPGRVTWEVLRPATLDALEARLRDDSAPRRHPPLRRPRRVHRSERGRSQERPGQVRQKHPQRDPARAPGPWRPGGEGAGGHRLPAVRESGRDQPADLRR